MLRTGRGMIATDNHGDPPTVRCGAGTHAQWSPGHGRVLSSTCTVCIHGGVGVATRATTRFPLALTCSIIINPQLRILPIRDGIGCLFKPLIVDNPVFINAIPFKRKQDAILAFGVVKRKCPT